MAISSLSGKVVCICGDFPYGSMIKRPSLVATIERLGGRTQKSPINVDLIICGDDASDYPIRAKQSNPDVVIWGERETVYELGRLINSATKATDGSIAQQPRIPQGYGDF